MSCGKKRNSAGWSVDATKVTVPVCRKHRNRTQEAYNLKARGPGFEYDIGHGVGYNPKPETLTLDPKHLNPKSFDPSPFESSV